MKNLLLLFMLLIHALLLAQAPQAFNYQGIARNDSGTPLTNSNISLRLTIREEGFPGTDVYKEEHHVTTNKLGVFNVEVGHGVSSVGDFGNIQWGGNEHYIQIEIDPAGGQNFILMGSSQLLSVPYALYAGSGQSQWKDNPEGIHYTEGHVGIGTNNPSQALSIVGNDDDGPGRIYTSIWNQSLSNRSVAILSLSAGDNINQTSLAHLSETYDFNNNDFNDFGQLDSRGAGLILTAGSSNGVIRFMTNHAPLTNAPLERMRISSTGNVGIGTRNPQNKLSITNSVDDGDDRFLVSLDNPSTSNRSLVSLKMTAGNGGSQTDLTHNAISYDYDGDKYTDFGQLRSNGRGLILRSDGNNSSIKFLVGNTGGGLIFLERMRINSEGNVGIGTENPATKLQITDGDVFIENINKGVIMKSPNGSCWRVTVENDGSLKTSAIACPN